MPGKQAALPPSITTGQECPPAPSPAAWERCPAPHQTGDPRPHTHTSTSGCEQAYTPIHTELRTPILMPTCVHIPMLAHNYTRMPLRFFFLHWDTHFYIVQHMSAHMRAHRCQHRLPYTHDATHSYNLVHARSLVNVCAHVCTHVCTHVCKQVCTHVFAHLFTHVDTNVTAHFYTPFYTTGIAKCCWLRKRRRRRRRRRRR